MTGQRIVMTSWATLALFTLVAVPDALGLYALGTTVTVVSLALFAASLPVWVYSYARVLVRSAHGDDIAVASWVFLMGSAPKDIRKHLLGAAALSTVIGVATAFGDPFCVLVPMFHLGLAALWGARYGTYPARRPPAPIKGRR